MPGTLRLIEYDLAFNSAQRGGIFANGKFGLTYLFRCDTRPPNGENYGRICDPVIDAAAKREIDAQSDILFLGFEPSVLGHVKVSFVFRKVRTSVLTPSSHFEKTVRTNVRTALTKGR